MDGYPVVGGMCVWHEWRFQSRQNSHPTYSELFIAESAATHCTIDIANSPSGAARNILRFSSQPNSCGSIAPPVHNWSPDSSLNTTMQAERLPSIPKLCRLAAKTSASLETILRRSRR